MSHLPQKLRVDRLRTIGQPRRVVRRLHRTPRLVDRARLERYKPVTQRLAPTTQLVCHNAWVRSTKLQPLQIGPAAKGSWSNLLPLPPSVWSRCRWSRWRA